MSITKLNEEQRYGLYMIMLAETDLMLDEYSAWQSSSDREPCNDGFCVLIAALIGNDKGENCSYEGIDMYDFPELQQYEPREEDKHGLLKTLWFDTDDQGWYERRKILINAIEQLS